MSAKYSHTTADYLNWDAAINLIHSLFRNNDYRMSLLIGCGCFFGLRISDLLCLSWNDLLSSDNFSIREKKTGKQRNIKINRDFQKHINDIYHALHIHNMDEPCFINKNGAIISVQYLNRMMKHLVYDYHLSIGNVSTHTLRKTWARKIWEVENNNGRGEMALLKLSELMNHSSPAITRRYIGLRKQELGAVYDNLTF